MKRVLFWIVVLMSFNLIGQPLVSYDTLEYNEIRAVISDGGILFNDNLNGVAGYEWPKDSGTKLIYALSFWLGGLNQYDSLCVAGQRFSAGTDLFPGPYSSTGMYNDPLYESAYSPAIWDITQSEIDAHIAEYNSSGNVASPSYNILNWPAIGDPSLGVNGALAPFVDLNLDGIYDPYAGDYPNIKGCEAKYIIMNDDAADHSSSQGYKLGVEVHFIIYHYFSWDCLDRTTFVDVRVINKGSNMLSDLYIAHYCDADIGNYLDDYMGSDPNRNLAYMYNGDLDDESANGNLGYGSNPPVAGIKLLSHQANAIGYFNNSGAGGTGDPGSAQQYYNFMQGLWKDGTPMYYGGDGYGDDMGTGLECKFMFPGASDPQFNATGGLDPGFQWYEFNTDGAGSFNPANDRRMYISSFIGGLNPGEEFKYDYAVINSRRIGDFSDFITGIGEVADSVQYFYDNFSGSCADAVAHVEEFNSFEMKLYPNPNNGAFIIELGIIDPSAEVYVYDMAGRLVHKDPIVSGSNEIRLNTLSGLYVVHVRTENGFSTQKIRIE